jgi:hypothetical protein
MTGIEVILIVMVVIFVLGMVRSFRRGSSGITDRMRDDSAGRILEDPFK